MSEIRMRGLSKAYGPMPVLRSIDLDIPDGCITAVLGGSGSGKTTLLRLIAGFEEADAGSITIAGQVVDDGHRTVRSQHRGVGYVPQDAALFPHLDVAANIGFGVRRSKRGSLAEVIDMVGLSGLESRYPHQLSGGQQQRVALARALAIQPRVVLLDEPFGALDAGLRDSVRTEVLAILGDLRTTTVLVTHDQDEALSVADQIALLEGGNIVAHGSPRELYDRPPTPEIARAIGTANIVDGAVDGDRVSCVLGDLAVLDPSGADAGACQLLLRPEQILISEEPVHHQIAARIRRVRYHGHDTLVDLTCLGEASGSYVARVAGESPLQADQRVWLTTSGAVHVWRASGVERG